MFNKERFHNQLALNLGYERLLKDSRYDIKVDYNDSDNPIVSVQGPGDLNILFKASEANSKQDFGQEINEIIDAVQQAYIKATANPFWYEGCNENGYEQLHWFATPYQKSDLSLSDIKL